MQNYPTIKKAIYLKESRYARCMRTARDATFPVPLWSSVAFATAVVAMHMNNMLSSMAMSTRMEYFFEQHGAIEMAAVVVVALLIWLAIVFTIRIWITLALYYRGWLFDPMGKPSPATKAYMVLIGILQKCKPTFHSLNGLVPVRPLPSVKRTVELYLNSVKPLMSEQEFSEMVALSHDFMENEANVIQSKLWLKWLSSSNYMDDWWKKYAYNANRDSLIYTNTGGADTIFTKGTHKQAARTANLIVIHQIWYANALRHCKGKPISLGGIPMASDQYYALGQSIRRAHQDIDIDEPVDQNTKHAVIWYRNVFYKLDIYRNGKCLRPYEIQKSIEAIMANPAEPSCIEEGKIGAITTANRDNAARIRDKYFSTGLNKVAVELIENAKDLFFLTDDELPNYDESDPSKLDYYYKRSFGCDGYQIWCERPVNSYISKNGKWWPNGEHSQADGLVTSHLIEHSKYYENLVPEYCYDENGDCMDKTIDFVPVAEKINWNVDDELKAIVNDCAETAKTIIDDIDVAALVFSEYGKDFMKTIGVSPDAFIQMALQLTYFKDQNKFGLTYESALSRLFYQGRTETVRSVSEESCAFVRAMVDSSIPNDEKLRQLKIACDVHQMAYKRAMTGDACDRHLFAMYIVSKGLEIKSTFLNRAMGGAWELSTSQTPQHQQPETLKELNKHPELLWPAGAFTAPKDGGNYGVCYTVGCGGNQLSFFITSWKHLEHTEASRFRCTLLQSLREMKQLAAA